MGEITQHATELTETKPLVQDYLASDVFLAFHSHTHSLHLERTNISIGGYLSDGLQVPVAMVHQVHNGTNCSRCIKVIS